QHERRQPVADERDAHGGAPLADVDHLRALRVRHQHQCARGEQHEGDRDGRDDRLQLAATAEGEREPGGHEWDDHGEGDQPGHGASPSRRGGSAPLSSVSSAGAPASPAPWSTASGSSVSARPGSGGPSGSVGLPPLPTGSSPSSVTWSDGGAGGAGVSSVSSRASAASTSRSAAP